MLIKSLHFSHIGKLRDGYSAGAHAKLLLHYRSLIVAMKGFDLSILEVENIARRDVYRLALGS